MRQVIWTVLLAALVLGCSEASIRIDPEPPAKKEPAPCAALQAPEEACTPDKAAHPRQDFVVITGVHGNEPSGARLQPELEKAGYNVFGPCNPWGLKHNRRSLENGKDLNRQFGRSDCPEAEAVKEWLKDNQPALLLDLHEDPKGKGCYLIVVGPEDEIGSKIVDALKADWDFAQNVSQWGVKAKNSVIQPSYQELQFQAFTKIYSLIFYTWKTYGCTAIIAECPGSWPMKKKMAYHRAVVDTALKLLGEPD